MWRQSRRGWGAEALTSGADGRSRTAHDGQRVWLEQGSRTHLGMSRINLVNEGRDYGEWGLWRAEHGSGVLIASDVSRDTPNPDF